MAYLVPKEPSHLLLDTVFSEAMSRWGGRRTPIIITDGDTIRPADWLMLDLWDADLIYSYQQLDVSLHDRIAYGLAPASITIHPEVQDQDRYTLRPRLDQLHGVLKSISVLPRLGRQQEVRKGSVYEVWTVNREVRLNGTSPIALAS